MKLHEIKQLNESGIDYVVYKVSSPSSDHVYYGYSKGEDIKKAFMAGAGREAEPDRGDVRMITSAGGDPDNLSYQMLDVFDNEFEAFMERNDLRAKDSQSITGPTNFPVAMFQRARAEQPDRVKRWKLDQDMNTMTARQAMDAGAFSFDVLKQITAQAPQLKKDIIRDLDKLLYPAFKSKYLD